MNASYVYHGSPTLFEVAVPKRQLRYDAKGKVIFDQVSFHATPIKWIAYAYMFRSKSKTCPNRTYNMGVNLYTNKRQVDIFGHDSLETSLSEMYDGGGYLFVFDKDAFFHTSGLGTLECITQEKQTPLKISFINNPVEELIKLGIKFRFREV